MPVFVGTTVPAPTSVGADASGKFSSMQRTMTRDSWIGLGIGLGVAFVVIGVLFGVWRKTRTVITLGVENPIYDIPYGPTENDAMMPHLYDIPFAGDGYEIPVSNASDASDAPVHKAQMFAGSFSPVYDMASGTKHSPLYDVVDSHASEEEI